MNKIIFELTQYERIEIVSNVPIETLVPCDDIAIWFIGNTSILLYENTVHEAVFKLKGLLQKALAGQLKLHDSIIKNIGYMWNQELHNEPGLVYESVEGHNYWVGQNNLLWSSTGNREGMVSTWLYNDAAGAIILEITPDYRWHFDEPAPDDVFVSYELFMQHYSSCLQRTLSRDVARRWLAQVEQVLQVIEDNEV